MASMVSADAIAVYRKLEMKASPKLASRWIFSGLQRDLWTLSPKETSGISR
jgi:hypothetical protein